MVVRNENMADRRMSEVGKDQDGIQDRRMPKIMLLKCSEKTMWGKQLVLSEQMSMNKSMNMKY